ncbi:hypothetical protein PLIIFM63780_003627 [Purpureocillium lilacinum]|nr:hypothetical protein PLIIFM63780_003627 [Purpureocillium lilacinum]
MSAQMQDTRSGTVGPKRRVAYIRTVIDKDTGYNETDWCNLRTWLRFWVGKEARPHPFSEEAKMRCGVNTTDIRHHYILAYRNAADEFVLDWLIGCSTKGSFRLRRRDFTVYLSQAQASDPAKKELLQRLQSESVSVHIVPLDKSRETLSQDEPDACEEALLSASDYLLETYLSRAQRISPFHSLWRDSLRHGHREASNAAERSKEYSEGGRLRAHMGGYSSSSCSYPPPKTDAWRRAHDEAWRNYACPSCGKRCKRSKGCRTTGEWWTAGRSEAARRWGEDVDTSAPRPPEFEKEWRDLSVEDVVARYGKGWGSRVGWKWQSVDTFSGE